MKNKKTVIVTGGAGFLGSNLVPALIKEGYAVHVIDNLVSGKKERVPKEARLHVVDICDAVELDQVFTGVGEIDCVFHLAALPRVQFSIDHIEEAQKVNVFGLSNVFQAARKHKVRRLVYSASSSVYGNQRTLPLHEGLLENTMSPYAIQKHFGELMARQYALHYGVQTVSLRYFNIFGPHFDPNGPYAMAIGKFLTQCKNGEPLTVTGDGSQTRDCVHVSDVVRANMLAAISPKVGRGEVINIGSGKNPTILSIAKMICKKGNIVHLPPRVEPHDTRADIKKAKKLLGWTPKVTLKQGIEDLKKEMGIK